MLPKESHDYRARESILHMLAETDAWMELFVKNGTPADAIQREAGSSPKAIPPPRSATER